MLLIKGFKALLSLLRLKMDTISVDSDKKSVSDCGCQVDF